MTHIHRKDRDCVRTLSPKFYALMPRIRITGLLADIDKWNGFVDCLTHLQTGEAATELPALSSGAWTAWRTASPSCAVT